MKIKAIILMTLLIGCAGRPDTAQRQRWFVTESDLKKKEADLETHTLKLIDQQGLLLYRAFLPFNQSHHYVDSHDIADAPAWQGYMLMAAAFKEAVTKQDQDPLISRLAAAFQTCFSVTGKEGLLGRSWIADYTGERRPWMETKEDRPTKYWMQNDRGQWWRNGLAKDHWNLAVTGCAVPLTLHRKRRITLSQSTETNLINILVALVRHLVEGGFRLRDWDGGFTEFGDLRPGVGFSPDWPTMAPLPNGFNMVLVLNGLKSAGYYNPEMLGLYEEKSKLWRTKIGISMEAVGEFVKAVGHWKLGKPSYSDMQAYALASMSLIMQEDNLVLKKDYKQGMTGLWSFMRHERNAPFTLTYVSLVRTSEADRAANVVLDLRDFPGSDMKKGWHGPRREGSKVYPLASRPINTNYWKSSPFRHVSGPQDQMYRHPDTGADQQLAAMDYLLAYWMGRYFGLVPER